MSERRRQIAEDTAMSDPWSNSQQSPEDAAARRIAEASTVQVEDGVDVQMPVVTHSEPLSDEEAAAAREDLLE